MSDSQRSTDKSMAALRAVHQSSIREFAKLARQDLSELQNDLVEAVRAAWADARQVAEFRQALHEDDATTLLEAMPMGAKQ